MKTTSPPDHLSDEKLAAEQADTNRPAHLRERARLLSTIPAQDRVMVSLDASYMVNVSGGLHSSAIASCVRSYLLDPAAFTERFEERGRATLRAQELERAHLRAGTAIGRALERQMDVIL